MYRLSFTTKKREEIRKFRFAVRVKQERKAKRKVVPVFRMLEWKLNL